MLKIAVTGSISSGKSTVCELLKQKGAYILSADQIVHKLLKSDKTIQNQLSQLLNQKTLFINDDYKEKISEKIFNDTDALLAVEGVLHPRVMEEISQEFISFQSKHENKLFICEVPLLFEANLSSYFDIIIYVTAEKKLCMKRFCDKTHRSQEEWQRRMNRFLPESTKLALSNFIIDNSGSIKDLKNQINKLYHSLLL